MARRVRGIPLDDYLSHLDRRALFAGRWGLRGSPEELAEQGEPRLRELLAEVRMQGIAQAGVAYGFFAAHAEGDSVIVQHEGGEVRWSFPRQLRDERLCLADFVRAEGDVIGLMVVSVGPAWGEVGAAWREAGRFRDFFELHGLGAALAEALADHWHERMRKERGIDAGQSYSFGFPACPDLSARGDLARLVGADRIGVEITDGHMLVPEHSVDALVLFHPAARLFSP